ncbi:MAG: DUF4416 family protein [Candidatus Lindowbacteria bacterium]|nr:DUF4416 family protein [Candidatus Lindowbacteria bacterium]
MGQIRTPDPVKLFVGMLAEDADLFGAAQKEMTARFGAVDVTSEVMPFNFTDYYTKEMGPNLLRKFAAFERLIDPSELVSAKLLTNGLEKRISEQHGAERRLVNLDPGYISHAKLVLASTKDYSHRIYVGEGIFAEITLYYSNKRFNPWPWTYADYKTDAYCSFFEEVRRLYVETLKRRG